jgi:SAM-dependent methyltransferase
LADSAERFTGRVEEYERYRLRYPAAVLTLLQERCGLRAEHVVADVGAGTGMLAELFLEAGNAVEAVEPNAAMRGACERLQDQYARLRVVDATAEATTLEDASVDFVSVGRAFHWFDTELALREFRRVLRPGGWVVLVANGRGGGESEQAAEYEQLLVDKGVDHRGITSRFEKHDVAAAAFDAKTLVREQVHGEQRLRLAEFLGQTQSYSSAPLPGDAKYDEMQRALREYFARWQVNGVVRMATLCLVTCGRFAESASSD